MALLAGLWEEDKEQILEATKMNLKNSFKKTMIMKNLKNPPKQKINIVKFKFFYNGTAGISSKKRQ